MRKSHSLMLVILLTLSLCASAFGADAPAAAAAGVVNINTADTTQLSYLPRVGEKVAQRIVDYRKEHGPFRKTSDLMQVKGFGEKSFERISAWLTVDGKTTLTAKIHLPRKPRSKSLPQPTN
ncbi:MAG TPA: helix-hairpin-helix domain-containing protein [Thermoanaerobaculia bacterium]|jgi:competence ComEA-like helix-hairpin-helix protein|nr:helix-hairpin-helix domain-containing protein [Thermoanaerobaculia bacterium]